MDDWGVPVRSYHPMHRRAPQSLLTSLPSAPSRAGLSKRDEYMKLINYEARITF